MKKTALLILSLCVCTLSYAQGGKIIKPVVKAAATEKLAQQEAKRAYQAAARQYSRLTPPLVSSDYALKLERNLRGKEIFSSAEWQARLHNFLDTHIARLAAAKAQREEALINYGKALVEGGELSAISGGETRRAVFVHQQPLLPNTKPFEQYVRIFEKAASEENVSLLPLKQRAMFLFLKRELVTRSEELNQTLRAPGINWTVPMKQGFAVARYCTQMLYLMQTNPDIFKEDLFRLYILAANKPQTPFNDYIKSAIRKTPYYGSYYSWFKAEQTGINPVSFEEMCKRLSR